ncbi:hypothetical protein LMG33818_000899 [Halomonadaceae bacterium LMG 33818]|uniref:hypothetical protein n=1 Tax=Cernens ardua TaxID=3402176 RepID=UPI003EDC5D23
MSIEVRVVPMERYQVTRSTDQGIVTVAENLTKAQAEDIASAIHARADAAGKNVLPIVELPLKE